MSGLQDRRRGRDDRPVRFNWWNGLGIALVAVFGVGGLVVWIWAILTFLQRGG